MPWTASRWTFHAGGISEWLRIAAVAAATGETGISVTVFLPTERSGQSVLLHRPTVRPPRAHNVGVAQDQSVATAASGVSTPPSGSKQPSKDRSFSATWPWNHSMWQKVGFAAATWTLKCGAQWPENSS